MSARPIWHGLAAAASVVVGAAVAVGINIATERRGVAVIAGVLALVLLWAALEGWRATRSHADTRSRRQVSVAQRIRRVAGSLVGVRRAEPDADVTVKQRVNEVAEGGQVTGYDGTT